MRKGHISGLAALPLALAAGLSLTGCGTPGAPMPPSLNLPDPVIDLAAVRAGNQVSLTWTMPKRNTDKLLLKGDLPVWVCRKDQAEACTRVDANLLFAPGASGAFTETLPPALTTGALRPITYFVELPNRKDRSAGLSNGIVVLAGQAPAVVANLTAEARKDGVILRWTPGSFDQVSQESIRLHRKLLTPAPETTPKPRKDLFSAPSETQEKSLIVESGATGRALDKDVRFGEAYEYSAQFITQVDVNNQVFELAGPTSAPVRVQVLDIFPPAAPTGLAAVASAPGEGIEGAIDLSWQPNTETDLAGYFVYRREASVGWQRISPSQPLVGPAFHDISIQPGHTYRYAVTAIDQGGRESARSADVEEAAPGP